MKRKFKKPGRKPLSSREDSGQVYTRLPLSEVKRLAELAKAGKVTISEYTRTVLRAKLGADNAL